MASKNLKPKNSSDSEGEAEWTFIDSDEGTIETRKDSVTYRKPTYSEILKGVVAEDLVEEVDSEPEFEVLASFKFRPKGESFGLGSSASKAPKNAKAQGKGSKHEVDYDDESPQGDDSSCSDDGIMIISSKADEPSTSKAPSQASDDDYNKIDETDTAGSLDNETEDNDSSADKNIHDDDDDDDDDFVIADETESDFEETTMDDTAEPDEDNNNDDDDDEDKGDIESDKEELTESTANTLNASAMEEESHDADNDSVNSDEGLLGIHKGGICDNPGKDLDWDSLTFQLLSTLPRMNDSTTTLGDDNQNPISQDGIIDNIQDSDSENNNSHSSYAAISQDDSSSFDELSDSADVNTDFSSEPMIPRWLFKADKDIEDAVESSDDDSDYIISDIEELEFEESGLIPQWFFGPSKRLEVEDSIDGDFEFINSDLDEQDEPEKDPDIPRWLYDPCYKAKYIDDDDFEEPNPIIPRWFFDPNYKIPDLDETEYDDDTDYSDSEYDWESEDDDSMTLPRWLFDKRFKPPEYADDEEGFSWPSQLFVDIPTFIILLCLTAALGFSIGHGLTVYLSSQAINRNAKLQDMETPAKQFPSPLEDLGLTPEEIAKIDLLKLEDELEQRKESDMLSEHLRFDLRELYKSLKEKHYRLLRNQKSTEDRLHISKTMSWYWRMKYDEEKRRKKFAGVSKNLRPKNFSDMANLARTTKLAKKWRRLYKKNYTAPGLGKAKPSNSNLKWLVKPSDAAIKQHKGVGSRYLMKAIVLSKKNDMTKFRNRWTQDFKELKDKSCSHPNKSVQLKKKATISSPFAWVNGTQKCKRVNRSDILGRCLIKEPPLAKTKNTKPTIEKPAKKDSGRKTNDLKLKPCFSKPKNANKPKKTLKRNKVTTSSSRESRKPRRNSAHLANRQEKVRKERIKKRELKKKSLEIKNQVNELKVILKELRRERRRAEREKAKLEASWRKLKQQRLKFEKERKEKKKNDKNKVKNVKTKLKREKTRLKTWKNVAKRAQKKAEALHKDLKRVSATKQKLEDIKHIKKDLKLEKRKLREQQKNLKSIKQQLRKEHRNYARERWKTKKKRKELEKQSFNQTEPIKKKIKAEKKAEKTRNNHIKAKKHKREKPSPKRSQDQKKKKKKQKARKKFWENLEKSLYDWAQKVNRTIEHHRRGKAGKIWKKLRTQFDKLVAWTTGNSSKATDPKKKKKEHQSKTKVKIKNPVFEKILAEQIKYDEEKRNKKDLEDQWKSKGPVVNKKKKKKKQRKKKDPDTLLRQKQRKQRRKYQRELERLQQWALQMNEKKLEHERIYKEKEKMGQKGLKTRRNPKPGSIKEGAAERKDSFSNSRALVSVEDSNSTLMLLLQPQISISTNYETSKTNTKQKHKYQDKESVIRGVTRSQINHELNKKKTDTSLTLPLEDAVMKLPDDVNKGLDITSFGDESRGIQEPTPPSLSPTFYKDFPILRIIDEEKRKREGSVSVEDILSSGSPKDPEIAQDGDDGQRSEPWYMRRAEQRDNFRNTNPVQTLFRPIGPLKSDGTWFFHRSSDRALKRELYEPLNRQSARDGFKHKAWRSYFHRGRRRNSINDGEWVFERASDRADQRSNNEPWYMRRAEGREEDREESRDSWFVERGFDRDLLHDYDEDDEDDDLMNDYDYDDYADHSYDNYEGPWL